MANLDDPAATSSPMPPTTPAQLSYQYDLIDDSNSVYSSGVNPSDYDASPGSPLVDANELESISEALVSDQSLNHRLMNRTIEYEPSDRDGDQFNLIMESRTSESNEFRVMIVCLGLVVISIGILANLLFSLLVICKRRRGLRSRAPSTSLIIMASMSIVYLVFLVTYCFKISVYFSGDNIIKFHIYDTIENWPYGNLMCKLLSASPICCKLISRLSLLSLVLKRLVGYLSTCDLASSDSPDDSVTMDMSSADADVNIISQTPSSHIRAQSKRSSQDHTIQTTMVRALFKWPFVNAIVAVIWVFTIAASWPLLSSYFVRDGVCDSGYRFPEDIRAVQSLWLTYLIFVGLIFISLLALFVLQTDYCVGLWANRVTSGSASSFSSSQQSTPNKNLQLKSSSTASFDEINDQSTGSPISSNRYPKNRRPNNLILWVMWFIMIATSLPQELYRYTQLKIDFNNDQVLSSYLESILVQPIVRARPYYAMQLIYIAEFALLPLVFILFYSCSVRVALIKRSDRNRASKTKYLFGRFLCDPDLVESTNTLSGVNANESRSGAPNKDSVTKNLLLSGEADVNRYPLLANHKQYSLTSEPKLIYSKKSKPTPLEIANLSQEHRFPHLNQPGYYHGNSSNSSTSSSTTNTNTSAPLTSKVPSNNVLHIIQHPSWRINIKQQPNSNRQNFANKNRRQPDEHLSFGEGTQLWNVEWTSLC